MIQSRRRVRWVVGILAAIFGSVGVWVAVVISQAQAQIAEHERELNEASARLRTTRFDRIVALGVPIEGNAWNLYDPAFSTLHSSISDEGWVQVYRLEGHPFHKSAPPDEALLNSVLDTAGKALAPLRDGLRRTQVDPRFDFRGQAFNQAYEKALRGQLGLEVLALVVARDHERGDEAAALDRAALLLGVAQDLPRGGCVEEAAYGARAEKAVLVQLAAVFRSCAAAPDVLRRFAEGLARLYAERGSLRQAWENDDGYQRAIILDEEDFKNPWGRDPIRPGWRCLFSKTVMRAQALNLCHSGYRRLIDAAVRPPAEQERLAKEIEQEFKGHPNGVVSLYLNFNEESGNLWTVPGVIRECTDNLMHRSLLRVATALALYEAERGKVPDRLEDLVPTYLERIPVCPLTGKPVSYAPGRIWLPGRNGVDDGGVAPDPDDMTRYSGGDKDIVWAVSRKKP
jgi:hypothetical protein